MTESAIVGDAKQHDSSEIIVFLYYKRVSTADQPEISTECKVKHEACHSETNSTQTAITPQGSTFSIFSKRRLITAIAIRLLNKGLFVMQLKIIHKEMRKCSHFHASSTAHVAVVIWHSLINLAHLPARLGKQLCKCDLKFEESR